MRLAEISTPALCADRPTVEANIDRMASARPGPSLRPHVKAFKSTELARLIATRGGHHSFCCATLQEIEGMVTAGLDHDLLLANETLDGSRLAAISARSAQPITIAVDSPETIRAASQAVSGDVAVIVDVNVGMPRCGVSPDRAGAIAAASRAAGLEVRGVMGYEGHVVGNPDRSWRAEQVAGSMELLAVAHDAVGGEVISAGGTGTYDLHDWATEVQAGSYVLMDSHYDALGLPFRAAGWVESTVISVSDDGYVVADAGLKSLAMDHGNPRIDDFEVFFCSDEHTTFAWEAHRPEVGDRIHIWPSHVDPTVAYHERFLVTDGRPDHEPAVIDEWAIDLRGW